MKTRRMKSLYNLTLKYILSNRDIDYSTKLPKMLYKKIGRRMKTYNRFYFAKICDDFQLFCDLLQSNSLSELFLIRFFKKNENSVMKLVEIYTEADNKVCVEFGVSLGNLLKYSGFLTESEKVLIRASDRCDDGLEFLNALRELLHVQTLLNKKREAEQTYDLLLKCIRTRHEKKTLSNIYMSLASYQLMSGNISNAREWSDRACKYSNENDHLSVRNKFEIYINQIKILRLLGLDIEYYHQKAYQMIRVLRTSRDSLLKIYEAKLKRESILDCCHRFKKSFIYLHSLFVTVIIKYYKTFGYDHVLTIKVIDEYDDLCLKCIENPKDLPYCTKWKLVMSEIQERFSK